MKSQIIEAGRVTQVSAGRFGYSLKINDRIVPQGVTPFATHGQAMRAMKDRVRKAKSQAAAMIAQAKKNEEVG